jgi:hypothetical protein
LVLGLALVVGSVALLLGGALFGLSSYLETMQTTRRKLDRMQIVVQLRDHIQRITFAGQGPRTDDAIGSQFDHEKKQVLDAIQATRLTVKAHTDTLQAGSNRAEPDDSEDEARLLERLGESLVQMEKAVAQAAPHRFISPADARPIDPDLGHRPVVPAVRRQPPPQPDHCRVCHGAGDRAGADAAVLLLGVGVRPDQTAPGWRPPCPRGDF